jgi:TFIIF-interacting CTD phosphatase-like protein
MIRHRAQKEIGVIIDPSCTVVADRRIINNVVFDETRDLQYFKRPASHNAPYRIPRPRHRPTELSTTATPYTDMGARDMGGLNTLTRLIE